MDDGERPGQPDGPDQPPADQPGQQPPEPEQQTNNDDKTELSFSVTSDSIAREASAVEPASSAEQKEPAPVVWASPAVGQRQGRLGPARSRLAGAEIGGERKKVGKSAVAN